jgi:hypothetical protein
VGPGGWCGPGVVEVDGTRVEYGPVEVKYGPVEAERVVQAAGRRPYTDGLGLEALGLPVEPGQPLEVDEHCRVVGTENVWAVGDVGGVAPFTHTAHYQGRVVAANLSGRPVRADYRGVPRAVYTTPVLAAVGHTEASARAAGIEPMVADAAVSDTVRGVDLRGVAGHSGRGAGDRARRRRPPLPDLGRDPHRRRGRRPRRAPSAGRRAGRRRGGAGVHPGPVLAAAGRAAAPSVRELAGAIGDLAGAPGDRPARQRAADRALDLARSAPGSPTRSQPALAATVAIRMVATDVMVFAGVDPGQAADAAREGSGALDVPDPPPGPRMPFHSNRRRPPP